MKKKLIISGADRRINPWLAFMLSLAVTGLGQVYSARAARGTAYMLLRVIAVIAIPCYSVLNPGANVAAEIASAITVFILVSVISPVEALSMAIISRRHSVKKKYNSAAYYSLFAVASLCITALSLLLFFSCFSFIRASAAFNPLVAQGDILIVNKMNRSYSGGDAVFDRNYSLFRIIALPGETVSYKNRIMIVNGTELRRSIYTEEELNSLNLTDNNVTSESSGRYSYAVIPPAEKFSISMQLSGGEYCAAADERKNADSFIKIRSASIAASFEGVLVSPSRKAMIITPLTGSR